MRYFSGSQPMVRGPSAAICLVVCDQRLFSIFKGYKHTNRSILAIFHGTIFNGGPRPRNKICKGSLSMKKLRTAEILSQSEFLEENCYDKTWINIVPVYKLVSRHDFWVELRNSKDLHYITKSTQIIKCFIYWEMLLADLPQRRQDSLWEPRQTATLSKWSTQCCSS